MCIKVVLIQEYFYKQKSPVWLEKISQKKKRISSQRAARISMLQDEPFQYVSNVSITDQQIHNLQQNYILLKK